MGHTNSTANYNLPQFVTTDKPAWLTDINGAFSDIDTAIDAAKDAADAAQSDATDALTAAGSASTAATSAGSKADGAIASLADTFSTTDTYTVGDLVMYNSLLYICTAAVTTPGDWTGATNWSRKTVEGIIDDVKSDTTTALSAKADVATTYTMNQVDGLLANKLDSSYHVSSGAGVLGGLLGTEDRFWLIIAQRVTTNNTLILIAHKHSTSFLFKEVVKDSGMTYTYNQDNGSIVVQYGGSSVGVYIGAYRLA